MTASPAKHRKERLVLFDAHAIIHRAYHALPEFTTKNGVPTGGLYGLSTLLFKAISDLRPDHMAACYDLPGPTFRHKEYAAYKAGRAKADDALIAQLASSREIFTALNIPIYDKEGFEADDMLGTIVEKTKDQPDIEIIIVSGDMDTLQLVEGTRVRVFTLRKGLNDTIIYDEDAVRQRFGFGPELLPDYKGLRGDPSDNIIGVPGIGEKSGTDIIAAGGSIENIYATLKKDKDALIKKGVTKRASALLLEHEDDARFSKVLATIRRDAPITFTLPSKPWIDNIDPAPALLLFSRLEFKSLSARLLALLSAEGHTYVRPGESTLSDEADDPMDVKKAEIAYILLDTERGEFSRANVLEQTGARTMREALVILEKEIVDAGLDRVYRTIEIPLIPIIEDMQKTGILLDRTYIKELSIEFHKKLSAIESRIYTHAGEVFNLNSPKQLGTILFDTMQLSAKGLKKTAGGARSTRESELEKMKDLHPIISDVLSYRELQKLTSTYVDTLPAMVGEDGRIHTTFHQMGAATGRMSSVDPNMQNIPVRDGYGTQVRNAFIAAPGKVLVSLDYSQIELRVLAMLSGDESLTEIFRKGEDIHTAVAMRVFHVAPDAVTSAMRRSAKAINFGIIYGMGITALQSAIAASRKEAEQFSHDYFAAFPTIATYLEKTKTDARAKGYSETMYGRRRYFRDISSPIPYMRATAERMAMNAPIQGTAADIVKLAMIAVDDALAKEKIKKDVALLLQVHDELVFEITDDESICARATKIITTAMEGVAIGTPGEGVPLSVSISKGKRWGEL